MTATAPAPMIVTPPAIQMPDQMSEVRDLEIKASAVRIYDHDSRQLAADILNEIATRKKAVIAEYKPIKQAIDASKQVVLDREKAHLVPLENAERAVKSEIARDHEEQDRIHRERARIAAEQARKEAEEQRLKDLEEAQAQAAALGEKITDDEIEAIIAAPVVAPVAIVPEAPKVVGAPSGVKKYRAEVVDMKKLLAYVLANPQWINLVEIRQGDLDRLANQMKEAFPFPGCSLRTETQIRTAPRRSA
jgi:hypothetical protein